MFKTKRLVNDKTRYARSSKTVKITSRMVRSVFAGIFAIDLLLLKQQTTQTFAPIDRSVSFNIFSKNEIVKITISKRD